MKYDREAVNAVRLSRTKRTNLRTQTVELDHLVLLKSVYL